MTQCSTEAIKEENSSYGEHYIRSHQPQYSLKPKCNLYQIFATPSQLEEVKELQKKMFEDSRGRFTKLKK